MRSVPPFSSDGLYDAVRRPALTARRRGAGTPGSVVALPSRRRPRDDQRGDGAERDRTTTVASLLI